MVCKTALALRSKLSDIACTYQTYGCRRRLQSTEENTALSQGAHVFKQQQILLYFVNIFNDQKWYPGMKWIIQSLNTQKAQSHWVIAPKLMCVEQPLLLHESQAACPEFAASKISPVSF